MVSILYAIAAMLLFGVAVFLYKQGTPFFSTGLGAAIFIMSHMLVLGILSLVEKTKYDAKHFKFIAVGGALGGLAQVCFFLAMKHGKLSTVVPIRNLALLITIGLGVIFLGEQLTPLKIAGIVLGLIAVVLVSI
ncbi:EamA family transporter [Wenyingzhuangia aestuarii]|uniref:EamA family transporter n=1 Tax=Wenyingzhuangia aestuarii TaxID=1647582 RepID=UPI00143B8B11|nr:EamA family transporter [Wenyingzhuangia aestuarii]NJB82959.1 putative membrane protein [Wenyingzhuangia aestuarii]